MCWVSTTCFNSTAVEAEGIYATKIWEESSLSSVRFFFLSLLSHFLKSIYPVKYFLLNYNIPGAGLGSQKITKFKIFSLKMSILEKEGSLYLACYCHHHFCAVR